MKRLTNSDKLFLFVDYFLLTLLLIAVAYPLLYVIISSIAPGVNNVNAFLIPKKISFEGYKAVIKYKDIWTGYANSLINMVLGTGIALVTTMLCAYPLSRPEFKARNIVMIICMITMYFGGGLIPNYLLIRNLGLMNTRWALILPGAMSVYNMIVTRTYIMSSIPNDIRESAQLDGCGHFRYLLRMVVPLSGPILAVIGLFFAVGIWNSYFDAMLYVSSKRTLYPLSLVLRELLVLGADNEVDLHDMEELLRMEERRNVMKYAVIVVASLPVMILYPFVQRFFVKGVMIGAVKG